MPDITPVIPETITVHLGLPSSNAENVTVSFPDYIKNVASSEIYPTWPTASLYANIYVQITFAMNRVYTEFYRSQGYSYDITSSTTIDQAFIYGRDVFENISQIVDEIFNSYIIRRGYIEPYFTQYCNGTSVTCDGLSQWGTVDLANQGSTTMQILQYYYGEDIEIVRNVPVQNVSPSAPLVPLRLGSVGNDVKNIQLRLNRISQNYPRIPKIYPTDGYFGTQTESAVREFQNIFNLTPDGVVGNATWYRIQLIFNGVKRLNDLNSEGLTLDEVSTQFPEVLQYGDSGEGVRIMQYFLAFIGTYVATIPVIAITGYFGEETRDAVYSYQSTYGLTVDGIVGELTWNSMFTVYRGLVASIPEQNLINTGAPFPGIILSQGMTGDDIVTMQEYLNTVATVYPEIPTVTVNGVFDTATYDAVIAFQELFGYEPNGRVGPFVWDELAAEAINISKGNIASNGQFPGDISS